MTLIRKRKILTTALIITVLTSTTTPLNATVIFYDGFEGGSIQWTGWRGYPSYCSDPDTAPSRNARNDLQNKQINKGVELTTMTLQNACIGCFPDLVVADLTSITAGSEGSTMQAGNLKNHNFKEPARLDSIFPHESYWNIDFQTSTVIESYSAPAHNLVPGDQWRVIGVRSGEVLPPVRSQTLPPTAIEASTNLDPANNSVTNVDEHPSVAEGTGATGTIIQAEFAVQNWSIRFSFGTPSSTPAGGGKYQCFVLSVRVFGTALPITNTPKVTASLYEGGVLRNPLGVKAVTLSQDNTALVFPWDASDLVTGDGSDVELLLEFTGGDAGFQLDAVAWEVLHASDLPDTANGDYDSGWQTVEGGESSSNFGNTTPEQHGYRSRPEINVRLNQTYNLENMRIEFRADHVGLFSNFQSTPPITPVTYIDLGGFLAGPLYHFPFRFALGGTIRFDSKQVGGTSIAGTLNNSVQWRRLRAEIEIPYVPRTVAMELFERLNSTGISTPFQLSLDPTLSGAGGRVTTWIAKLDPENEQGISYGGLELANGERVNSLSYSFIQAL